MKNLKIPISPVILVCFLNRIFLAETPIHTIWGSIVDKVAQSTIPESIILIANPISTNATTLYHKGISICTVLGGNQTLRVSF